MTKKTKPSRSQVEHIKKPFVDKSGGKPKMPKEHMTTKVTDAKLTRAKAKDGIKLKKGKGKP